MSAVADNWQAQGVTNLVGGFWRNVRQCLHPDHWTPRTYYEYELTLAWVMGEGVADYPEAPTFEDWCSLGGIDLDPDEWRKILLSGVVPDDGLPLRD